jgi:hypothetical protein
MSMTVRLSPDRPTRIALTAVLALGLLLMLGGFGRLKLVEPKTPHWIGTSEWQVTPGQAWSRSTRPPETHRGTTEMWTAYGLTLDRLWLFAGLADGQTLLRQGRNPPQPLPAFKASMQPNELAELVEASYRISTGATQFEVTGLKPLTVSGQPGFQLDFAFTSGDDVKRLGRAAGSIVNGKLYLIVFDAPRLGYFEQAAADVDAIIASATFAPPPKPTRRR